MKLTDILLLSVISCSSASVFQVISKPKSISLPEDPVSFKLSEVPLIASQFLGLSTKKPNGWTGKGDLLHRPECVAMFLLTIPDHFEPTIDSKFSYVLIPDESPSFKSVESEIRSAFSGKGFTVMDISKVVKGSHADDLNQMIPDEVVKTKFRPLREELMNMKAFVLWLDKNRAEVRNFVPDLYVFEVTGLLPVISRHGHSPDSKEARKEVGETIQEVSRKLKEVYSDNCFIGMVTQQRMAPPQRNKRETGALESTEPAPEDVPGLYDFYKPDFPVAFNIILWTMVFISLTVLFVSVGMWFMDPGKDSIIYRMTMQRAKKD